MYEQIFIALRSHIDLFGGEPPFEPGQIESLADAWKERMPEPIDDVEFIKALGEIKEQYTITQNWGETIVDQSDDHKPWWMGFKNHAESLHYWTRFKLLLTQNGELPLVVINRLDQETDDIVDLLGNPNEPGTWSRRGMVIGHVQSGKTQNYSSVICKAADAGFKVIVLLAGITNPLRKQTQERINEAFIGRRASRHQAIMSQKVGVGLTRHARVPDAGTYIEEDFNASSLQAVAGFSLGNRTEPIIFVCKKHVKTLENLFKYFQTYRETEKIEFPFLLIDDEADNASINTKASQDEITKTNAGIRNLLKKFSRSSYVGYTATPFANIFIDPVSEDGFGEDDLFPKHYIRTLEAPNNYMGANKVFGEDSEFFERMVNEVSDNHTIPIPHKNGLRISEIPVSLRKAVIHFILAKAIRVTRDDGQKHCSMMVNVSIFNSVQDEVEGHLSNLVSEIRDDLRINAMSKSASRQSVIHEFKEEYEAEFTNKIHGCEINYPSWKEVSAELFNGWNIDVRTVNSGNNTLDYQAYADNGYNVIAIGGLALSRGLTLEGLCSSYVLRNASQYDTLMQMGRWFGYRKNYEDLCRLYINQDSITHYQETSIAIDELRQEIKSMKEADLSPKEFGLKVRQSPHAIRITAANKMRTAESHIINIGYGGKTLDAHTIFSNEKIVQQNLYVTKEFVSHLGAENICESYRDATKTYLWRDINVNEILSFLGEFIVPNRCLDLATSKNNMSLVHDFIVAKKKPLERWNVHLNNVLVNEDYSVKNEERVFSEELFEGTKLLLRKRTGALDGAFYKISKNRKVGSGEDAKIGLPIESYEALVERESNLQNLIMKNQNEFQPSLILYFIKPELSSRDVSNLPAHLESGIVSFVLHFPSKQELNSKLQAYQTNIIYQQLELFQSTADEDDEYEELNR